MAKPKLKPVEANDGSYGGMVLAAFDALAEPPIRQVRLGRELFRFGSFEEWVNKAQSRFATYAHGIPASQYVCIDDTGCICTIGKQFMSARDRDAFPIVVYHIEPDTKAIASAKGGL